MALYNLDFLGKCIKYLYIFFLLFAFSINPLFSAFFICHSFWNVSLPPSHFIPSSIFCLQIFFFPELLSLFVTLLSPFDQVLSSFPWCFLPFWPPLFPSIHLLIFFLLFHTFSPPPNLFPLLLSFLSNCGNHFGLFPYCFFIAKLPLYCAANYNMMKYGWVPDGALLQYNPWKVYFKEFLLGIIHM